MLSAAEVTDVRIISAVQGSQGWHDHRARTYNASELARAMGIDPNGRTRCSLVKRYATGIDDPEFSNFVQERVINPGHEIEACARSIIENRIGETLYPVTLAGNLNGLQIGASLDGLTIEGREAFECKRKNKDLWDAVSAGVVPDSYRPQLEQGLMLSGAEVCLFTVSDGTEENTIHCEYRSDPTWRAKIEQTWRQFAEDVSNFIPEPLAQDIVATPQMELPAVVIQVNGQITISDNLARFGDVLTAYVSRINKSPETDQDFADLDDQAKNLRRAIEWLDAAENSAMAQAEPIDAMRRVVAQYRELARSNAILAEKLVKVEKDNRKATIIIAGREELAEHVKKLNSRLGGEWMPVIVGDFVGVTKGLKTIQSYKDKVSTELARCKIEANEIADTIEGNRKTMVQLCDPILFPDWAQVCTKAPDDFAALVAMRVSQHKEAERRRLEEDQRGKTTEATHAAPVMTATPQAPVASTPPDNGKRLKLGELKAILAPVSIDAEGLAQLGIKPIGHEKAAKLYRECDINTVCLAIIGHMQKTRMVFVAQRPS